MSKYKDHYVPAEDIKEFNDIYLPFIESIGGRYSCGKFAEYKSDGSVGWPEGIKIAEIHSYDDFYASTSDFYKFYLAMKKHKSFR